MFLLSSGLLREVFALLVSRIKTNVFGLVTLVTELTPTALLDMHRRLVNH